MRLKMGLLFSNEQAVRNSTKESDTPPYIYALAGAHTPSNVLEMYLTIHSREKVLGLLWYIY